MGGPNPLAGVLIRRGRAEHVHKEDTGRMPCDEGGRDWSDASTCQGTPRIASNYQKRTNTEEA